MKPHNFNYNLKFREDGNKRKALIIGNNDTHLIQMQLFLIKTDFTHDMTIKPSINSGIREAQKLNVQNIPDIIIVDGIDNNKCTIELLEELTKVSKSYLRKPMLILLFSNSPHSMPTLEKNSKLVFLGKSFDPKRVYNEIGEFFDILDTDITSLIAS